MILDGLNERQLEAVNIITGPLVVYAGAGTGKTKTLTYRIANMVDKGIDPTKILAITFTKKATNEMRERLYSLIGASTSLITISTIHGLCAKILRKEIQVLGYSRSFTIIDDDEQLKVVKDCIQELGLNSKLFTPRMLRNHINEYKFFNIKPSVPIEMEVILKYEEMLKSMNLLDFQDLLLKVEEIFRNYPIILDRYQNIFENILVDEFQDTDLVQYKIISMLASKSRNLFLVGDDDQSIYSFRGTNYENIKLFKLDFPEYKSVILDKNYRSTQKILDGCNKLIANNTDREKKSLKSDIEGNEDDIYVHQALNEKEEVNFTIDKIRRLVKDAYDYSDIAILYRNSSISRNFELGLVNANIPYRIFGGVSYLQRKEIKDITAYFRLLLVEDDILSFKRVINEPARGIGLKTIDKIISYKNKNKTTLKESVIALKDELKGKYSVLEKFFNDLERIANSIEDKRLDLIFDDIIETFNFSETYADEDNAKEREENLLEFKSILVSIEESGEIASRKDKLIAALDEAILSDDKLQSKRQSNDGVTLSTIHSVKGLEFKVVFVVALEDGLFPSLFNTSEDSNLEEERRVAYVAFTRAKEKLFLTCASKRMLFGSIKENRQSRFLREFIRGITSNTNKENKSSIKILDSTKEKAKVSTPNNTSYHVGDTIIHSVYGEGMIVSLKDTIGVICFTSKGMIKTFDMTHKSITKKE